jgi:hypothetical protein
MIMNRPGEEYYILFFPPTPYSNFLFPNEHDCPLGVVSTTSSTSAARARETWRRQTAKICKYRLPYAKTCYPLFYESGRLRRPLSLFMRAGLGSHQRCGGAPSLNMTYWTGKRIRRKAEHTKNARNLQARTDTRQQNFANGVQVKIAWKEKPCPTSTCAGHPNVQRCRKAFPVLPVRDNYRHRDIDIWA